ncbi:tetratricopeptide repeat protein [Microbulbifer sp. DLAB2-AA]|uniref:tetratricopeptide repeat protein n=1 Tax=Microbulbifer sp. DLAB2-AA TaxID=3243394 RepID=UPI00403A5C1A
MRWKEIIIGAIITLIITIIGGITVWKFTKEPSKPEPKSIVVAEADSPAKFKSDSKSLIFNTIRIGNLGDKVAQSVILSIEFPEDTHVTDFSISSSSGAAARKNLKEIGEKKYEKIIAIDSLLPEETVTISILTNEYTENELHISGRYSEGLVQKGSLSKRVALDDLLKERPQAGKAALTALVLGILLAYMTFRIKNELGAPRNVNNTAFMLLHNGLVEEAATVLETNMTNRGSNSYEMANLGLCKALMGSKDASEKYFSVAELYSTSKQIKALVAFNRAIVSFESDEFDDARRYFESAVTLASRRIKLYVKCSKFGTRLAEHFPEFSEHHYQTLTNQSTRSQHSCAGL